MSKFRKNKSVRRGGQGGRSANEPPGFSVEVKMDELSVDLRKLVQTLAPLIVGAILNRTHKGVDSKGRSFNPYSPGYAAVRKGKGLSVNPVDLRVTGRLLSSLGLREVQISNDGFTLTIAPTGAEMAKAVGIELNGRQFVGLSNADMKVIAEDLESLGVPINIQRA